MALGRREKNKKECSQAHSFVQLSYKYENISGTNSWKTSYPQTGGLIFKQLTPKGRVLTTPLCHADWTVLELLNRSLSLY